MLNGWLKANTYYYEEGNIQFNLKQDFSDKLSSEKLSKEFAKEIVDMITANENRIQTNLQEVYQDFSETYIKPLRRKLPSNINA